jgi:hypothetical protein
MTLVSAFFGTLCTLSSLPNNMSLSGKSEKPCVYFPKLPTVRAVDIGIDLGSGYSDLIEP